jgi:hypothetical protein
LPLQATLDRFRAYSARQLDDTAREALIDAVTAMGGLTGMEGITAPIHALL